VLQWLIGRAATDNRCARASYTARRRRVRTPGIVDLEYNTARFAVQYDDIEQATIKRN
jgi:hypothetical protein